MVSSVHVEPVSRSDTYKRVMKPMLERKRRARINKCLDELRDLLVTVLQSEGEAVTRLEKADILELTVRHVRKLNSVRGLALPPQGVNQQQEDVARFQQGFVAAAHQVQNFLMSTPLEPSVSSGLLTHLTKYATSIVPPPGASPPINNSTPPPPPPQSHQPPQMVSRPPQSQMLPPPKHSPPHMGYPPAPRSLTPPQQPRVPVSLPHHSINPHHSSHPLGDLSNRQVGHQLPPPQPPAPGRPHNQIPTPGYPIIRDVKIEDRMIAPSPFIDVESTTEPDDIKPFNLTHSYNPSRPLEFKSPYSKNNITQQLHVKIQTAEIPHPSKVASSSKSPPVRHRPYPLPKKLAAGVNSARQSSNKNLQSSLPQDLSIKKSNYDEKTDSWRPW